MTAYKIGKATVRIHGAADREKVKEAAERYVRKALMQERKKARARA